MRVTKADLQQRVEMIDRLLDLPKDTHVLDFAYGSVRLVRNGGAIDVSPRLPKAQLYDWLYAYMAGIDAAQRPHRDPIPEL